MMNGMKNDKLDALILLSEHVLAEKNAEEFRSADTSDVKVPTSIPLPDTPSPLECPELLSCQNINSPHWQVVAVILIPENPLGYVHTDRNTTVSVIATTPAICRKMP